MHAPGVCGHWRKCLSKLTTSPRFRYLTKHKRPSTVEPDHCLTRHGKLQGTLQDLRHHSCSHWQSKGTRKTLRRKEHASPFCSMFGINSQSRKRMQRNAVCSQKCPFHCERGQLGRSPTACASNSWQSKKSRDRCRRGQRRTDALFPSYLWVQCQMLSTVLTGRCVTGTVLQDDGLKEESTPSAGCNYETGKRYFSMQAKRIQFDCKGHWQGFFIDWLKCRKKNSVYPNRKKRGTNLWFISSSAAPPVLGPHHPFHPNKRKGA